MSSSFGSGTRRGSGRGTCGCGHAGSFILEGERLPGSTRFMALEEFERGSVIDECTNVYTMGRTALVLLEDRIPTAMGDVARRGSEPAREERYAKIADFVDAWRSVTR